MNRTIVHGVDNVGALFPHDRPVKEGGTVAEPTIVQRKMLAKMGLAMPDGSFYIRNGVVGAKDLSNAIESVGRGEADGGNGNDIRRHIMKRAGALKLSSKIPGTWSPDGSLKHSELVHYGVKGMQWDHHKAPQNVPFIQRGNGQQPPNQQGSRQGQAPPLSNQERADRLAQLIQLIHGRQAEATQQSAQDVKANPSPQATATHAANVAHLAQMATAAKQATAANVAHKAANGKKPAAHPAHAAHAAKMKGKAKAALKAHAAHKAKHPGKKSAHKTTIVKLNAKQKAELAKLSPAERTALAKLSPSQRAVLAKMSPKDKAALSHLSQKQKDALAKATAASAKKRHAEALARHALQNNAKHSILDQDVEDFLAHFGVKGMHWGVRRGRPTAGPSSADHHEVVGLGGKVKSHGGIHALSNDELQKVITRLNLEQNYHRLTSEPGGADKGRAFVKKAIADAKTGIDLYKTLNQVGNVVNDIQRETAKRQQHQSRRTRNAPLRVVSVK